MPSDPDVNEMEDADGIQINAFGNITIFDPKPLQLYWPGFEPPPLPSTTTAKPTTTTSKPIGITKPNQNQAPTKSPVDPRKTKFVNVKYEPRRKFFESFDT
uniref:Uncharacterized protein n=1 Tax=Panagrolaimus superbus TaxID=310955 RepID=A0A914Z1T5_9BILA